MAGSIKGIIVEIGGDTSNLQKALQNVNKATTNLQRELNGVNRLLNFDPKNTELLAQKQTILSNNIKETTTKLEQLRQAQKMADDTIKNGGTISQENYRNLQREIINTENRLQQLKLEASNWTAVSKSLDTLSTKMKTVGSNVSNLGNKFIGLSMAVGAGIGYGVKYNAQLQKYETALKTLTGSAEEAEKIMNQIKEDAKTTPFGVSGLTQANQLMISTGLSAEDSRETILALGNAISATGGGDEELSRMAINLQQIKNLGKAAAVDIKQFAYAGIDIYGLLADYMGVTKEEAANMDVTWENLNGALISASKEGGKYFGAMEEQSKTFNGAFSNAMDSFNQSLGTLTESLMPVLTSIIQKITDWMNQFNKLDQGTKDLVLKLVLLVGAIGPILIIVGKIISAGGVIVGLFSKISGAIAGLSAGTGALSSALTFITGPVGIVIAAITALVGVFTYLYNTNEQFRIKVQETWNNLVILFQNTVMPVINNLKNLVMSVINKIISILQQLWSFVEPFFTDMFMWLMDFWNNTGSEIFENVMGFVNGLIDLVSMIWNNVISPLIDILVKKFEPIWSFIFGIVSEVVKKFGDTIGSIIKSVTGYFKGIIDFITGVFSGNWEKAWQGIRDIFKNIVSGLANIMKAPINSTISLINGFINGINKVKVPDWVPGIGGKGISIPQIPYLAKGGIVDKATLAMIGEGKSAEAVIPLDNTLTKYMAEALREAGGRNNSIVVNFYPQQMTEAELDNAFNYINRKFGILY